MTRAQKGKKICLLLIFIGLMAVMCFFLNRVDKSELQDTEGRTFEKARVVEITDDNLSADGSRAGVQQVKVKIRTGEHKGEILDATSSSSYLYGADCTVGLRVIVIISE